MGKSATITKWPDKPQISGTISLVNQSISTLVSSYSGSLEQIRFLEDLGVDSKSLSLLKKSVQVMKEEADRQRRELVSSMKKQSWAKLEQEARRFEETQEKQMMASRIVEELTSCNLLSETVLSGAFFNLTPEIVDAMHTPCAGQEAFKLKIGMLATIFETQLAALRSKVKDAQDDWKSIRLLEEWAKQKSLICNPKMLEVWRAIVDLRNATYPFHKTDTRVVELVAYFGQDFPPDCSELWRAILQRFLFSINAFRGLLSQARAMVT